MSRTLLLTALLLALPADAGAQDRARRPGPPAGRAAPTPAPGRAGPAGQGQDAKPKRPTGPLQIADDTQLLAWFVTVDHDANEKLSFRETKKSLRFNRKRFQIFDVDRDGWLGNDEFRDYYMDSITRTGRFVEPTPLPGPKAPPKRTPEQLRNAYDQDLDRVISVEELGKLLGDYDRPDVSAENVLAGLDIDVDGLLSLGELTDLGTILHPLVPIEGSDGDVAPPGETPVARPTSIVELFGAVVERSNSDSASPYPPQILGPVGHFRRLDLDNDGTISVEDLEGLIRPVQHSIRVTTIVNTLDLDRDGVLSETELSRALIDPVD